MDPRAEGHGEQAETVRRPDRARNAVALALVPDSRPDIQRVAQRCRGIVTRRALVSAGASAVPIPGLDIAVDVGMLMQMITQINAEFGLTPAQIERLSPGRKVFAYKAITVVGSALVGRVITRELTIAALRAVGVRITARQAARFVPFAGQVIAATLSFGALKYLGNRHIEDCVRVAETMLDVTPTGTSGPKPRKVAARVRSLQQVEDV